MLRPGEKSRRGRRNPGSLHENAPGRKCWPGHSLSRFFCLLLQRSSCMPGRFRTRVFLGCRSRIFSSVLFSCFSLLVGGVLQLNLSFFRGDEKGYFPGISRHHSRNRGAVGEVQAVGKRAGGPSLFRPLRLSPVHFPEASFSPSGRHLSLPIRPIPVAGKKLESLST